MEIPLHAEALADGSPADTEATLSWDAATLPSGWSAALRDRLSGARYDLAEAGEVALGLSVALTHSAADLIAADKARDPLAPPPAPQARPLRAQTPADARFTLVLTPSATEAPAALSLVVGEVSPNPSSGSARLALTLPEAGEVTVRVFDALGRLVGQRRQPVGAGRHALAVPVGGLAPGAYVVHVEAPGGVASRRLTVVR